MKLTTTRFAVFLGAAGLVVFSLFLMFSGQGDHAESYRTWILATSIIVGSGVIAAALERG